MPFTDRQFHQGACLPEIFDTIYTYLGPSRQLLRSDNSVCKALTWDASANDKRVKSVTTQLARRMSVYPYLDYPVTAGSENTKHCQRTKESTNAPGLVFRCYNTVSVPLPFLGASYPLQSHGLWAVANAHLNRFGSGYAEGLKCMTTAHACVFRLVFVLHLRKVERTVNRRNVDACESESQFFALCFRGTK